MGKFDLTTFTGELASITKEAIDAKIASALTPVLARLAAVEARAEKSINYSGVWHQGRAYDPGDAVTHSGGLWIAKSTPAIGERPGDGATAWTLAVKRGDSR